MEREKKLYGMESFLKEQGVGEDELEEEDDYSSSMDDSSSEEAEEEMDIIESAGLAHAEANLPPQMSKEEEAALGALTAPEGEISAFLASISQKAAMNMQDDHMSALSTEDILEEEDAMPFFEEGGEDEEEKPYVDFPFFLSNTTFYCMFFGKLKGGRSCGRQGIENPGTRGG